MPRPIEALIHRDAVAANLRVARQHAGSAKVWAVVKAHAYGHGIEAVFPALAGADGIAMLDFKEAEQVRALGWRGPVLMLEGCFSPRDLEVCSRLHLAHVIHREAQIDWLAAHPTDTPHSLFLKLNSGMNRLGFAPDALGSAWARLCALPQAGEVSLMTHFASADRDEGAGDGAGMAEALTCFEASSAEMGARTSLANSAAILRGGGAPNVMGDWVRAGIMIYGASPDHPAHTAADWGLAPAMTLRSQVIATQHLQPGDRVGYGGTFTAQAPMRIGIVACGYADGYPRHAPTGTPVLVDGKASHTVGRVSMDLLAVDLTATPSADCGSEVTLWGRGPRGSLQPIDEVAQAAGTIGYELMCALSTRVPKTVV